MKRATNPFERLREPIPVAVTTETGSVDDVEPGCTVIRVQPHAHEHGDACAACASAGDIRASLFNLLEAVRRGEREPFSRVLILVEGAAEADAVQESLAGKVPARSLRDHAVARNFVLDRRAAEASHQIAVTLLP